MEDADRPKVAGGRLDEDNKRPADPAAGSLNPPSAVNVPSAITDSPWFWLLLFSGGALFALAAIAPKYSLRQGGIETKFQNRDSAIQWEGQEIGSSEAVEAAQPPTVSDERQLLIPLRPLFLGVGLLVLLGLVGLSLVQLKRGH